MKLKKMNQKSNAKVSSQKADAGKDKDESQFVQTSPCTQRQPVQDVEYEASISDLRSTLKMVKHPRFNRRRTGFAKDELEKDFLELEEIVFLKRLNEFGFDIF